LHNRADSQSTNVYFAVLDSSGQAGSGFLLGNNHWLGSTKGCESVKAPLYITLSDRFDRLMKPDLIHEVAPFEMEYRVVYAKHYSPWQVEIKFMTENLLHIGLCLPSSCTNSEIHNLTQEYLNSRELDAQSLFEFESDVLLVKDLKLRDNFFLKTSVLLAR
jgi:Nose resistant-to-fluoxetine protein, N-terminal domain